MKFTELGLESQILQAIEKLGYETCTPIQADSMPVLLEGRDLSGLSQTGTGKTAAFLVPLMDRILKGQKSLEGLSEEDKAQVEVRRFSEWRAQNFILILVPTRELAEQVYENATKLSEFSGLRAVSVYGGTSYEKQKEGLKAGVEFVVATPGRLIDLYKEHICDLKQVRAVVFDEADRMFDMGFKDDMKYILQRIPSDRQITVFSATMNFDVSNTLYQFGFNPVDVDVSRDQTKAENVKDEIFHCGQDEKPRYLLSLLKRKNPKQAIIFSNFKNNVERIAQFLTQNGIPAMGISSLLTQAQRNRVIEQFKAENEKNVLVATDVAARGLDIKGVDLVINYELPQDSESYVHRIGRTGRAGAEGTAFSLVSDRDIESLERIQDYLKNKLNVGWMEDTELVTDFSPLPAERNYEKRDRPGGRPAPGPRRDGGRGPRRDDRRGPPRREGRPDHRSSETPRGERNSEQRAERQDRPDRRPRRDEAGENAPRREGRQEHRSENRQTQGRDQQRRRDRPQQRDGQRDSRHGQSTGNGQARHPQKGRQSAPGPKRHTPAAKPAGVLTQVKSWFRKLISP